MERDGDDERVSVMLLSKSGKLSVARRVVLLIAYVLFIAVNVVSQTGAFGLPTRWGRPSSPTTMSAEKPESERV